MSGSGGAVRLPPLAYDDLSPEQREVYDSIASTHGGRVGGPFAVWMHSPAVADGADRLRNAFRAVDLAPELFQLLVLLVARHWHAGYPWSVHARTVRAQELLPAAWLDRISDGERPDFEREEEAHVYELVTELLSSGSLSEDAYGRAVAAFGAALTVEIVTIVGFYTTACLVANVFAIPPVADVPAGLLR